MDKKFKKWYEEPRTRDVRVLIEPLCKSGEEGNNGQIDDLVDFEDVWF